MLRPFCDPKVTGRNATGPKNIENWYKNMGKWCPPGGTIVYRCGKTALSPPALSHAFLGIAALLKVAAAAPMSRELRNCATPTHTRSGRAILHVSTNYLRALTPREQTALNKQKFNNTLDAKSTSACPRGTTAGRAPQKGLDRCAQQRCR